MFICKGILSIERAKERVTEAATEAIVDARMLDSAMPEMPEVTGGDSAEMPEMSQKRQDNSFYMFSFIPFGHLFWN